MNWHKVMRIAPIIDASQELVILGRVPHTHAKLKMSSANLLWRATAIVQALLLLASSVVSPQSDSTSSSSPSSQPLRGQRPGSPPALWPSIPFFHFKI